MKINSLLGSLLLLLLFAGCKDDELGPTLTQDNLLFGAFPRLIELRTGEFDLNDLENSTYEMEIDFVDNAEGADVASYILEVSFDDNTIDSLNPDISTKYAPYRVYGPSDFRPGPNGNLGLDVSIPFSEVATTTGISTDDIRAGDRFQFRAITVKADGREFGSTNSTSAITNAFNGIIDFNVTATCPLAEDRFAGTYKISYGEVYDEITFAGAQVQAIGAPPLDRIVELSLVSGSSTQRTFPITTYLNPGFAFNAGAITLDFACDQVTAGDIDAGAACAGGTIEAVQQSTDSFDLTDDSTFTITYTDFADDGGCGQAPLTFTLVFTKQ